MTDYDKLIKQLEILEFKREDFSGMYRYTKDGYTFKFNISDKDVYIFKIRNRLIYKDYKNTLKYLNTEFKSVIRKNKISKLIS